MSPGQPWQSRWARSYGESLTRADSAPPVVSVVSGADRPRVSSLQQRVFDQLKQAMPAHDLQMEVRINEFPVDVLIDGHLCLEVDGPYHFVQVLAEGSHLADGRAILAFERRTRDRFIDHMLHHYGYRVFRLADAQDPARVQACIDQIRAALASSWLGDAEEKQPQADSGARAQDSGHSLPEEPGAQAL